MRSVFWPIVGRTTNPYRLLDRRAIFEFGFHLFKALQRHFRVAGRASIGRTDALRCVARNPAISGGSCTFCAINNDLLREPIPS